MIKENLKDYILMVIQNQKIQEPYYSLLGDSVPLYDAIWNTEELMAKQLGIPEDIQSYFVREFVYWFTHQESIFAIYDEFGNQITTIDELVDYIVKVMEDKNNG